MKKYLIISKSVYETKLALLEDNKLDEIYIERNNQKEITGNIYKGKVVDILNNGEIIFVDIGLEKNDFLSFENKKNIPKFSVNDKLVVQAKTEPRDEKGAKLTLDYSISGENLVLLPKSKNLSISKKIKDVEEVNRLKNIFLNVNNGLILRTDSEEKSEESLLEEYRRLENIVNQINRDFEKINIGLLYDNNSILKNVVVLFDEIDVIALDRINSNDIREMGRVTSTILRELDRLTDLNKEIVLIATTNLYSNFDKALIRRFDAVINFNRYSDEDLIEVAEYYFSSFIKNFKGISKDTRLFKKIRSFRIGK